MSDVGRVVLEDRGGGDGEGVFLAIGDEFDRAGHARLDGRLILADVEGEDGLELAGLARDRQDAGEPGRQPVFGVEGGSDNTFELLGWVKASRSFSSTVARMSTGREATTVMKTSSGAMSPPSGASGPWRPAAGQWPRSHRPK